METLGFNPLDISSCEAEPIRYPGAVQPHGALLVVDPASATIEAASESCLETLGLHAFELLGQNLSSVIGDAAKNAVVIRDVVSLQPILSLTLGGKAFQIRRLLNTTGQLLIEIEPSQIDNAVSVKFLYDIRAGMEYLRRLRSSKEICQAAAKLISNLTGLDQVMIYRFDSHWNGWWTRCVNRGAALGTMRVNTSDCSPETN
jgi:light-regulated signal transduction histidine kinase (bacteriophytochrome)